MSDSALAAGEPQKLGLSDAALRRLEAAIADGIERRRFPGAVSLIARRGEIAWFDVQGKLGPDDNEPMRPDSIFRVYSMTKPMVSVAIMMLVEEGKLLLSDFLHKYIPEFGNLRVAYETDKGLELRRASRGITIQDLLRHTSGLTYDFTIPSGPVNKLYIEAGLHRRNRTNEDLCRALAELPLKHEPGTFWEYSFSTDVLGRILEVVCGMPLREVLTEKIIAPLGMIDTDFFVPAEKQARIAEPFPIDVETGTENRVNEPRHIPDWQSGGGGLMSTTQDYARFLQMLLSGGTFGGHRILGRKTIELMTANHLAPDVKIASPLLPPGYGFGLGFAVRIEAGLNSGLGSVGHYFWGGIAGTTFFVDPREEFFALSLIQAPAQREYYRMLFRNLAYATLDT